MSAGRRGLTFPSRRKRKGGSDLDLWGQGQTVGGVLYCRWRCEGGSASSETGWRRRVTGRERCRSAERERETDVTNKRSKDLISRFKESVQRSNMCSRNNGTRKKKISGTCSAPSTSPMTHLPGGCGRFIIRSWFRTGWAFEQSRIQVKVLD